jgi:hypothetical protein
MEADAFADAGSSGIEPRLFCIAAAAELSAEGFCSFDERQRNLARPVGLD